MVAAIIELGTVLVAAKADLPHGSFTAMIEHKTDVGLRAAEQYMQIARHEVLANPNHGSHLPPLVGVLRVLAQLGPPALQRAIADGAVTPELDREHARQVVKDYGPSTTTVAPRPAAPAPTGADDDDQADVDPDDDGDDGTEFEQLTSDSGKTARATVGSDGKRLYGKTVPRGAVRADEHEWTCPHCGFVHCCES